MDVGINFLYVALAYCIGSISSAVVVCKLMGLPDPRTQGSKNPGATNVLRVGGKKAAAITLLADLSKGLLPVFIAKWFELSDDVVAAIAFAAFIGHLFPIFFKFVGGKGVATLFGCLIALSWPSAICWGITWLVVALVFRFSSLASLIASLFAPAFLWYFSESLAYTLSVCAMLPLLYIRHASNIVSLYKGTERKIGQKTKAK